MQRDSQDVVVEPKVCKGAVQREKMSGVGLAFPDSYPTLHSVHPSSKRVNSSISWRVLAG